MNMNASKTGIALIFAALASACSDQEPYDNSACVNGGCATGGQAGSGQQPPAPCPSVGSACTGEGSTCAPDNLTCHCGFWVVTGSDACKAKCSDGQPTPPATCVPGYACSQPGWTCTGGSGTLECYCGFWATDAMKDKYSCGNQNGTGGSGGSNTNPGTGGSGNTGNTGGYGPGTETYEVRIVVNAPGADHVWCEDAMTSPGVDGATAQFYEPWDTMMDSANKACDVWPNNDHKAFDCTRRVSKGLALQFQCYIETGMAPPGDQLRYTCAWPTQLVYSGESFATYIDGQLVPSVSMVDNPAPNPGFYNCKVQK